MLPRNVWSISAVYPLKLRIENATANDAGDIMDIIARFDQHKLNNVEIDRSIEEKKLLKEQRVEKKVANLRDIFDLLTIMYGVTMTAVKNGDETALIVGPSLDDALQTPKNSQSAAGDEQHQL